MSDPSLWETRGGSRETLPSQDRSGWKTHGGSPRVGAPDPRWSTSYRVPLDTVRGGGSGSISSTSRTIKRLVRVDHPRLVVWEGRTTPLERVDSGPGRRQRRGPRPSLLHRWPTVPRLGWIVGDVAPEWSGSTDQRTSLAHRTESPHPPLSPSTFGVGGTDRWRGLGERWVPRGRVHILHLVGPEPCRLLGLGRCRCQPPGSSNRRVGEGHMDRFPLCVRDECRLLGTPTQTGRRDIRRVGQKVDSASDGSR